MDIRTQKKIKTKIRLEIEFNKNGKISSEKIKELKRYQIVNTIFWKNGSGMFGGTVVCYSREEGIKRILKECKKLKQPKKIHDVNCNGILLGK